MNNLHRDTIVALSSGQGRAGVAVVRLSGPKCSELLQRLVGRIPKPRVAEMAVVRAADGVLLDRALVLSFPGPRSFTGEDVAEFHLHGSRAIVQRVLREACAIEGIRLAQPGEFSERAFENGKLDLLAVEDLADLIDSETELQRVLAGGWGRSRFRQSIAGWRQSLLEISALTEAQIDFSDEGDVPADLIEELHRQASAMVADIRRMLSDKLPAERIREGYQVVIAGPPNAGKSSLMNMLAGRDVAIVSPIPGTTRDILEVRLDLSGLPIVLRDVAGLRETDDDIEKIGIKRAQVAMEQADLVLWLHPADVLPVEWPENLDKACNILSKADLASAPIEGDQLAISVETGHGIGVLLELLRNKAEQSFRFGEATIMLNLRQESCLLSAIEHLEAAETRLADDLEFLAEDCRMALISLRSLVGEVGVEEVLGEIFGRFCIGK